MRCSEGKGAVISVAPSPSQLCFDALALELSSYNFFALYAKERLIETPYLSLLLTSSVESKSRDNILRTKTMRNNSKILVQDHSSHTKDVENENIPKNKSYPKLTFCFVIRFIKMLFLFIFFVKYLGGSLLGKMCVKTSNFRTFLMKVRLQKRTSLLLYKI